MYGRYMVRIFAEAPLLLMKGNMKLLMWLRNTSSKAYKVEENLRSFLTFADTGCELPTRSDHFNAEIKSSTTHCVGGWVRPRGDLDVMWREKNNFCPIRKSNSGHYSA
jgi:hypothetical protein